MYGTRWRWMVSFVLHLFCSWGRSLQYALDRRLGGPLRWPRYFWDGRSFLSLLVNGQQLVSHGASSWLSCCGFSSPVFLSYRNVLSRQFQCTHKVCLVYGFSLSWHKMVNFTNCPSTLSAFVSVEIQPVSGTVVVLLVSAVFRGEWCFLPLHVTGAAS
jgi:hypothetical protein